jgi:hypothetical protein
MTGDSGDHWMYPSSSILSYLEANGFPKADVLLCMIINMFCDDHRWDAAAELQSLHDFYLPFLRKSIDFRHRTLTFHRKPTVKLDDLEHTLHQWLLDKLYWRFGLNGSQVEHQLAVRVKLAYNVRRFRELYRVRAP